MGSEAIHFLVPDPHLLPPWPPLLLQVRDRATLYLYQLQSAPEGPQSVDPHWRIPAKGLEAALASYLAQPDTPEPFDLVRACCVTCVWQGVLSRACWGCLKR